MSAPLPDIAALVEAHAGGAPVADTVAAVVSRRAQARRPEAWISVFDTTALARRAAYLDALPAAARAALPLLGVPFAIKDNIDVRGLPTSAGCPAFAYDPAEDATAVAALLAAGAVAIGKTHLDQFATGLVGTRSPHGPCRNAHAAEYIAGGSSSGSAVAVAEGVVSFALGTDTAGSGRVPAALNGVVGVKPTRGLLSARGVVPACRSLDCVSIFANSCADAARVLAVLGAAPLDDPFCRAREPGAARRERFRFGVPGDAHLGELDAEARQLMAAAAQRLQAMGGSAVEIDYAPFRRVSELLYAGPWVAERAAAVGDFIAAHPGDVDPTVAAIITGAASLSARQAFEGLYELQRLARDAARVWDAVDLLLLAPAPRAYRIAEVQSEPLRTNAVLGVNNNFVNLLDLCACVVPAGVRDCGVPFGAMLCAPAFADDFLLDLGHRFSGAPGALPCTGSAEERVRFVVVGAHLRGMPLSGELERLGGRFESEVSTSPDYRLYALADTTPAKPGLCRVSEGGVAIAAELWSLPAPAFAAFVAAIPRPLAMGHLTLADGAEVPGFVCEPEGLRGARDISTHGGWRAFLASRSAG